jgi:hypothetical protein
MVYLFVKEVPFKQKHTKRAFFTAAVERSFTGGKQKK